MQHNQFDVEKLSDEPSNGKAKTLSGRLDKAANQHWGGRTQIDREFEKQQAEVPEAVLDKMRESVPDDVRAYLRDARGLHPLTVENWELGWHPAEDRLCVPIRDREGKLVSVSGRALVRDENGNWTDHLPDGFLAPKYLHSPFSRNKILYGMDKIVPSQRVGYLFEGFFQPIFSWQCGYNNVLGRMGTHLSAQGRDMLREWFDKLVLVPDGDHAGYQSCAQIKRELEGELNRIPEIVIAPMVEGKDADECSADLLKELLGPPNR
jgi:DNA primase